VPRTGDERVTSGCIRFTQFRQQIRDLPVRQVTSG
jgi:hypothetical protein